MESSVITTKGQIVIPKAIREKYKLKPGTKVFFEDTGAGVILKHIDAAFIKSLNQRSILFPMLFIKYKEIVATL